VLHADERQVFVHIGFLPLYVLMIQVLFFTVRRGGLILFSSCGSCISVKYFIAAGVWTRGQPQV